MLQVSEIRSFVLSCSYFSRVGSKSLSDSYDSKIMIALYLFLFFFSIQILPNILKNLQTFLKHLSHITKTFSVSTIMCPRKSPKFKLTIDCSLSQKPCLPVRIACSPLLFLQKLTYTRALCASYTAAWEVRATISEISYCKISYTLDGTSTTEVFFLNIGTVHDTILAPSLYWTLLIACKIVVQS